MSSSASVIRKVTRLAIFLRDGLTCVYCGQMAPSVRLSIDHINESGIDLDAIAIEGKRHKKNDNHPYYLVTACYGCNSSKKGKSVSRFCKDRGIHKGTVWRRIRTLTKKPIAPYREVVNLLLLRGEPPWLAKVWAGHVELADRSDTEAHGDEDIPF